MRRKHMLQGEHSDAHHHHHHHEHGDEDFLQSVLVAGGFGARGKITARDTANIVTANGGGAGES